MPEEKPKGGYMSPREIKLVPGAGEVLNLAAVRADADPYETLLLLEMALGLAREMVRGSMPGFYGGIVRGAAQLRAGELLSYGELIFGSEEVKPGEHPIRGVTVRKFKVPADGS